MTSPSKDDLARIAERDASQTLREALLNLIRDAVFMAEFTGGINVGGHRERNLLDVHLPKVRAALDEEKPRE